VAETLVAPSFVSAWGLRSQRYEMTACAGDSANAPAQHATRYCMRNGSGHTFTELVVGLSILAIIAAYAVSGYRARPVVHINNTLRLLLANLRPARTNTISKSVRYQVAVSSTTQEIDLQDSIDLTKSIQVWLSG
jgi:Tfp pilus assembly protein FimT